MKRNVPWLRACLTVLTLCCSFIAKGQQGIVSYQLTVNDKILGQKRTQNLILYIDGTKSVERIVKPLKPAEAWSQSTELNEVKLITTKRPYFIYKDFEKKKLILSDYIAARKYVINDTVNNFKWKISTESSKVKGFVCRKASLNFRGRTYHAWFTQQIPIQNGPWKFCGLPGLIVKISDTDGDFVYELNGIDLKGKFDKMLIKIPSEYVKDKPISYKEFRLLYKKKLEDNIKLSRVEQTTPSGDRGLINITLPDKQERF